MLTFILVSIASEAAAELVLSLGGGLTLPIVVSVSLFAGYKET